MKSLKEIHLLEKNGKWMEAIHSFEERLKQNPVEYESVLRLSFLLWYLHVEAACDRHGLDTTKFISRVIELFNSTCEMYGDKSEYLFFFGLMISLFPWEFGKDVEKWDTVARDLFKKGSRGDPENLWVIMSKRSLLVTSSPQFKSLNEMVTKERFKKELTGRGKLGHYYIGPEW